MTRDDARWPPRRDFLGATLALPALAALLGRPLGAQPRTLPATPSCVAPMMPWSTSLPRRAAAQMPTGKAISDDSASARSASGSETCRRSRIIPATGVR